MELKKCITAGMLAASLLCQSLFCTCFVGVLQTKAAQNVALNKPVEVSALEADSQWTGDKAVDGDSTSADSRWSGGNMKVTADAAPQWLTIDLKAQKTRVDSIRISFYLKVWSTDYTIQTRAGENEEWQNLHTVTNAAADTRDRVDEISGTDVPELKRYVRFYFNELNSFAGGHAISVREIEIMGTQEGVDTGVSSAQDALNQIAALTVGAADTELSIPQVQGYDIGVYGSEVDRLIADDGTVCPYRIGDRSFNLILKADSKTDASDTAKKNVTVTVLGNTGAYPELFPQVNNPNPMPAVLPTIQEWYGYEGDFALQEGSAIVVNDAANVGLMAVAQEFQADLEEICGIKLSIRQGKDGGSRDIYLESLTDDVYGTGPEGYLMVTGEKGIRIYSSTRTGVLYGTVTTEQILYQDAAHRNVPKGVIRDYPLYAVRGLTFDVARIPTRFRFLEDYSKILKWYKINEMQLHLNDNQWSEPAYSPDYEKWKEVEASHRLESELFPSLATMDSKFMTQRDYEGRYDYYYGTHTGTGGELYYTKEQYSSLQQDAADRGIELLMELDTPGHSTPYTKYVYENQEEVIRALADHNYLEESDYFNADGSLKDGASFYIHNPNYFELLSIDEESGNTVERQNAINARIFMTALFDEYLGGSDPLVKAKTVNAGVDEYWDHSKGNAFRRYMNFMQELLGEKYGKEVRMWGSLNNFPGNTQVNKDIIIEVWNTSEESPLARIAEGFRVINIPQPYMYTTPGRYHKDMVNEAFVYYNWDPVIFNGNIRAEKGEPLLLGAKAVLWGDENREGITEADLNERYVRLAAMLSEKTWGGTKEDDTFLEYEQTFDRLREGPGTHIANRIKSKSNVVLDYDFSNLSADGTVIYDASGNGYHGKVTGGSAAVIDGSQMLAFDGQTLIETPLESLGYPYTMSFDVYLDNAAQNTKESSLFCGYDGRLQVAGLNGELSLNRDYFTQSFGYTAQAGEKHRITIVGTYQATKLYVDGRFQKILYAAASDPDHGGNIGASTWADQDNNYRTTFVFPLNEIGKDFYGYLGNIKAYNKALSVEELAAEGDISAHEVDVARNRRAYTDNQNPSYLGDTMRLYPGWKATDGDGHVTGAEGVSASNESRWNSSDSNADFLLVDLGQKRTISKVAIDWEASRYAASYNIEVSTDGKEWKTAAAVTGNTSSLTEDIFEATEARYVKMQGVQRKSGANDYCIYEIKVYETVDKDALAYACKDAEAFLKKEHIVWGSIGTGGRLKETAVYANAVLNDVMAGQQEAKSAVLALKNAREAYVAEIVDAALKKAEPVLGLKDSYETESWIFFETAYQALKNAGSASLAQRLSLARSLDAAINGLKKKPAQPVPGIQPVQLTAPSVTSVKSQATKVKVTWNASIHAASYQLYRKVGSKVSKVGAAVLGTTAYDEKPLKGTMQYFVIALSGGKEGFLDSAAGSSKSIKLPGMASNVAAAQVKGKKAVKITWKKVKGASSYLVYRAEGKKGSFKKIASVKKKAVYQDKKRLKKGKTYYYKIVTVSGGKYSPMKAAKKGVKVK